MLLLIFSTTSATAIQIFPLFWKAVGILEKTCGLNVISASWDGASSNRKFFEMHRHFDSNSDRSRGDVVHKVLNPYFQDRYLYFIDDPPHSIKTARNCLYKSGSPSDTRYMWNSGLDILCSHVSRFYYEDLEMGLHFLPKITQEHIQLNSFSITNVRLAIQILSSSVAHVLREYGPPESAETSKFCELMDQFFDCMNVRNCTEHKTKLKPFLKPYTSIEDERFNWLTDVFLKYLSDWKKSIDSREGSFQNSARAGMFISHQTYEGLQITCLSMIEIIKHMKGCK